MEKQDINKHTKYIMTCDMNKDCHQHPLVCLVCTRRTDLRDCFWDGKKR